MIQLKPLLASALAAACLLTITACSSEKKDKAAKEPSASASDSLSPTQDAVIDEIAVAAIYNDAVNKLADAQSYTMTGSVNSGSVMGEVLSSVVTSVDCKYQKDAEGKGEMLISSEQRYDGKVLPHSTYIADGKYYISAMDMSYITLSDDFGDYDALAYAKRVEDTAISHYDVQTGEDGVGYQVRFEIPFGVYASEALDGLIGAFADDSLLLQPVTVRANIDAEGRITFLYLALENSTTFGDEQIEQSIVISLSFSDYDATTVTAPQDLSSYEDRTQSESIGQNEGVEDVPEDFTGDSLD